MRTAFAFLLLAAASISAMPTGARAADDFALSLTDHKFEPAEIKVPANKRITITLTNNDATPEEFDSSALKVEKVVPGKSKGIIRIGPLKPGRYSFIGEYHEDTAKGVVIAE